MEIKTFQDIMGQKFKNPTTNYIMVITICCLKENYKNDFVLNEFKYTRKTYKDKGYDIWYVKGYFSYKQKSSKEKIMYYSLKLKYDYETSMATKQSMNIRD